MMKDALTAALFERTADGQTIMYPNGVVGRGYIIPDKETEQRMRGILMWLVLTAGIIGGVGVAGLQAYFGAPLDWPAAVWLGALAVMALVAAGYRVLAGRLAHGLTPVDARLGLVHALKKQARAMPRWYLISLAIFSPLMAASSLYGLVVGPTAGARALGFVGLVLFASTTAQSVYGLRQPR